MLVRTEHNRRRVEQAHRWFERYGTPAVFFARLLPVVRTFISLPAGVARMPLGRFSVLTVLGTLPWCIMLVAVGDVAGAQLGHVAPPVRLSRLRGRGRRSSPPRPGWYCVRGGNPATKVAEMPVPLMDIRGQYADLLDEVKRAVCDVIDSGRFILGPNMRALEEEVAAAVGAGHGVAVANGTDALVLSLEALGIGRGDEVVTTAYTFYATAEAIARVGATPVFADIDPRTFNLDPAAAEAAVTERTRAIVAVHVYGQPADLPALREVARPPRPRADRGRRPGVRRDASTAAAPAASATWRRSRSSPPRTSRRWAMPAWSSPAAPTWPSGCACCASTARARSAGSSSSGRTRAWTRSRRRCCAGSCPRSAAGTPPAGRRPSRYRRLGLGDLVELPAEAPGAEHVYHLYVVRAHARDQLARSLTAAGIGCRAYYDVPLHLQPVFAHLGYRRGDLPETERAADEGLALPMFPTLDEAAQREVVAAVRAASLAAACVGAPPVRVWIDLTNSPHAVIFAPLVRRLRDRGWDVAVTARAFAQTLELLELHGIEHTVIGHHGGGSRAGKARAAADRVAAMVRVRPARPLRRGAGARLDRPADGLPRRCASRTRPCSTTSTRPSSTRSTAGWPTRVLVPDAIPPRRLRRFGVRPPRLVRYPGLKEEYYLAGFEPDPAVPRALGLDGSRIGVVLRPPADVALYHRFENPLFDARARAASAAATTCSPWCCRARPSRATGSARCACRRWSCPSTPSTATACSRAPTWS